MNDLISRQELIDAFKEEFYDMYADDFNYMIRFFNNLPAFEPEPAMCWGCNCPKMPDADLSEYCDKLWKTAYEHGKQDAQPDIVHCKDCRWWGVSNTCVHWDGLVTAPANGFCSYGERESDG